MKIAGRKFGLVRKAPFFYQICLKRNTSAFEGIELKLVFRKQNLQIFCPFSTSSSRTAAQNMKHQSGLFFNFTASLDFQPALILNFFLYFTLYLSSPSTLTLTCSPSSSGTHTRTNMDTSTQSLFLSHLISLTQIMSLSHTHSYIHS